MGQPRVWASSGFCRRGEVKEVSACAVVSGRGGLFYSAGISVKGQSCHFGHSQNGDIVTLSISIHDFKTFCQVILPKIESVYIIYTDIYA
jgi:hypothetical protein